MTFDSHSLDRLRELGRQLPKSLPNPTPPTKPSNKLHKIETEESPEELFKELIKASTDGSVPSHLITRLKELENKQIETEGVEYKHTVRDSKFNNKKPSKSSLGKQNNDQSLYSSFLRLLLEEDTEV